ncbi:MAG: hypothetical protein M1546_13995 [Chloroflexi bacterium]|nr:hypothetical protein [Chloroflexota bacterium]
MWTTWVVLSHRLDKRDDDLGPQRSQAMYKSLRGELEKQVRQWWSRVANPFCRAKMPAMATDTLTLALEGDVSLREFTQAMSNFKDVVEALTSEVAGNVRVEWFIDDLQAGSAIATVRGVTERAEVIGAVIVAYLAVGRALQSNQPIPYGERVRQPAIALSRMLDGRITSLRFETADEDVIVNSRAQEGEPPPQSLKSHGVLTGVVETLTRRRGLKFTIYDRIFDKPVTCYLKEGQEDTIRDLWGKQVAISGRIYRNAQNGRPYAVRDITTIHKVDEVPPGSYRRARGVLAGKLDQLPEQVIRSIRDG